MKTTFHIADENFTDYLKITLDGKEYYFDKEITLEYSERSNLDIEIEFIRTDDYKKINPLLKFFLNIFRIIVSVILFFFVNDDQIKPHTNFNSFNPFFIKKSFRVSEPDGENFEVGYIEPKYNKLIKTYSEPDIVLHTNNAVVTGEEIKFSEKLLKQDWRFCNLPVFLIFSLFLLAIDIIIIFSVSSLNKLIPTNLTEKLLELLGPIVAPAALIAGLIFLISCAVKSYRLLNEVIRNYI